MTALKMRAIGMLEQFSDEKIAYIISFMENIKYDENKGQSLIGIGKGKIFFPDNIDFCNEEIADLFYGSSK